MSTKLRTVKDIYELIDYLVDDAASRPPNDTSVNRVADAMERHQGGDWEFEGAPYGGCPYQDFIRLQESATWTAAHRKLYRKILITLFVEPYESRLLQLGELLDISGEGTVSMTVNFANAAAGVTGNFEVPNW